MALTILVEAGRGVCVWDNLTLLLISIAKRTVHSVEIFKRWQKKIVLYECIDIFGAWDINLHTVVGPLRPLVKEHPLFSPYCPRRLSLPPLSSPPRKESNQLHHKRSRTHHLDQCNYAKLKGDPLPNNLVQPRVALCRLHSVVAEEWKNNIPQISMFWWPTRCSACIFCASLLPHKRVS